MEVVKIPKSIIQGMVEHAKREWRLECCGILGGKDKTVEKAYELKNAEESSTR